MPLASGGMEITMKKHNKLQFLKSKSFYVVLSVAVIAIAAVTVVGLKVAPKKSENENLADLNSTKIAKNIDENVEENTADTTNTVDVALEQENANENQEAKDYTNDEMLEFDVGSFADEQVAEATDQADGQGTTEQTEVATEQEESVSVMQPSASFTQLSFNQDSSISWPVKGDVIRSFSMDKLVHYVTLNEWKTSSSIIISSEQGTEVVAAASGIVNKIETTPETGTTVTMDIGDGYQIVYGQLDSVTCEVGEAIKEGTVFAKVANPTKYYSIEGANLYLQMLDNGTPVNPMKYLAGEE